MNWQYFSFFLTWFQPFPSNGNSPATLQWVILSAGMLSPAAHASIGSNLSVLCAGDRFYAPLLTSFQSHYCSEISCIDSLVFQGLYQFILLVGPRAPICTWHSTTSFSSKVLATFAKSLIYNILLLTAFGSVLSAGGKISTYGWWAVLAGQRCNTAGSTRDLELQTKVLT